MTLAQRLWNFTQKGITRQVTEKDQPHPFFVEGRIVLLLTTRCNFSCQHCLRALEDPKDLPLDVATKTLEGARKYNYRFVSLTGGEPFLYPDLEALIERATALGYRLALVTNGYNLLEHARLLCRFKKYIHFLVFSLESHLPEEHDRIRRKGSFDRLMADFAFCRKERIPFRTQTTVSTRNIDQLLDIGLLAKRKAAADLAFTTMLPCPRTDENKLVLDLRQRRELFYGLFALGRILRMRIIISGDIRGNTNLKICHPMEMRETAVDAEGRLIQCCELGNFDHPEIRRQAIVADLKEESFDAAMKKLSLRIHHLIAARIADYEKSAGRNESPDFNSCFYCIRKILESPDAVS